METSKTAGKISVLLKISFFILLVACAVPVRAQTSTTTTIGLEPCTVPSDVYSFKEQMIKGGDGFFTGLWGISGTDVIAVGDTSYGAIIRYDGSTWNSMLKGYSLTGIWGSSTSDVFAVGNGGVILHYDGASWNKMASGTTVHLSDIWGSSSSDVYAVGWQNTILHYDGRGWSALASQGENFSTVWGSSGTNVFAAGDGTMVHYDGSSWRTMNMGARYYINSIWGTSGSDVFAVGFDGVILHYDGSSWSLMNSGTDYRLYDVWGNSPTDVFAVGYYYGTEKIWRSVILHFDGSSWSTMMRDDPYGLRTVWGSSGTDVFAAGVGVILHYNGGSWSKVLGADYYEYIVYTRPDSQVRVACQMPCPMTDDFLKKLYTGAEHSIETMTSAIGLEVPPERAPVYLHYTNDNVCGTLADSPYAGFQMVDFKGRATLCMFDYEKNSSCMPFQEQYLCTDSRYLLTMHEISHPILPINDYHIEEGFIQVMVFYILGYCRCDFTCGPSISACEEANNFSYGDIYPLSYYLCKLFGIDVDTYRGFFQSVGNNVLLSPQELKDAMDAYYGIDTWEAFNKAGIAVNPLTTFYRDADGDGYGISSSTTKASSPPAGYSASNNDCNDANAAVHPGASELCNNIDDDCNFIIDDPSGCRTKCAFRLEIQKPRRTTTSPFSIANTSGLTCPQPFTINWDTSYIKVKKLVVTKTTITGTIVIQPAIQRGTYHAKVFCGTDKVCAGSLVVN